MTYVVDWQEGSDYAEHRDGLDWYTAGKTFRALPWWRRLLHRHRAQTRAVYHGTYLERCVCGAYGFGAGYWTKQLRP